jgi:putative addiction module component (TIGR02574 family)
VAHMASIPKAADLAALSISERLDLMDRIWTSLDANLSSVPVPDWHRVEVERELTELRAGGDPGKYAEEVFSELKSGL